MFVRITNIHLLVGLLLLLFLLFSTWKKLETHNKGGSTSASAKNHVLILSTWRSGSTFAGQLFNQHPEVFYLMEPAKHIWNSMRWGSPELLQGALRDLLHSVFLCDMEALRPYISYPSRVSHLFMWSMSRGLCSPPACEVFNRSDIVDSKKCEAQCGHAPFEKISEACTTYNHVAVKTVRLFQLEALFPLLTDPMLHLHIIHLVRDPRAIYASRQIVSLLPDDQFIDNSINSTPDTRRIMYKICHSQVEIYLAALYRMPLALRGRYQLTRYEDLVGDPLGHLAKWYHFTGLTSSPRIQDWVYNITHWPTTSDQTEPLSIQKNAKLVSQAWRQQLRFQEVQDVQAICKEAMEVFGYKLMASEEEQRDLSLDPILPMNKMKSPTKEKQV
ncbi:carbohydrate sulfotransferase 5-like [Sceloporus undulatus]|uniref:carbohydrate sulfotransferase 5-like n=1 Tax=Sceloporus undulatus TaxID=8520 RepID=UPI001C4B5698|nr:carbohydrate sulfotransferase 5-like [Sceloporus undulatus]